eukprot:2940726-Prymnesium_polylepis.1
MHFVPRCRHEALLAALQRRPRERNMHHLCQWLGGGVRFLVPGHFDSNSMHSSNPVYRQVGRSEGAPAPAAPSQGRAQRFIDQLKLRPCPYTVGVDRFLVRGEEREMGNAPARELSARCAGGQSPWAPGPSIRRAGVW